MTTLPMRPGKGGFLRPFGCGWYIREFLMGHGPEGSPTIDHEIGACQADIFYHDRLDAIASSPIGTAPSIAIFSPSIQTLTLRACSANLLFSNVKSARLLLTSSQQSLMLFISTSACLLASICLSNSSFCFSSSQIVAVTSFINFALLVFPF